MWKRFGPSEWQIEIRTEPLEVAPHVAALRGIKIERRGVPSLRFEQRSKQKRAIAHRDAGVARQRRDSHRRRIGIGRGEVEPELENGRHRRIMPYLEQGNVSLRPYNNTSESGKLSAFTLFFRAQRMAMSFA